MRSIPLAMTRDFLKQVRWQIPLALLGGNLLQIVLLTSLKWVAGIDPSDPSCESFRVSFQILTIPVSIFVFAATVIGAQTQHASSRVYTLPISTWELVNWLMFPATVLMVFQMVVSTVLLNWMYELHWPFVAPTLFAVVTLAALQSALWFPGKSPLQPFYVFMVGGSLCIWYYWRCGWKVAGSTPTIWSNVTWTDVLTLIGVAMASYATAQIGMARNRCGESLGSSGVMSRTIGWFVRLLDRSSMHGGGFMSPQQAFFWCEWHLKGWALPITVATGMVIGLANWLLSPMDPSELIRNMEIGGVILSGFGLLCGLILGSYGTTEANLANLRIGPFLGSCPLSNAELSWTTLRVAARSVVIAWLIWAVPFAGVVGAVAVFCEPSQFLMFSRMPWWFVPSTLLGCWIAVGLPTTLMLTGRTWLILESFWTSIAVALVSVILSKQLNPETWRWFSSIGLIATGIVIVGGFVWTTIVAKSRSLITTKVVAIIGSIWGLLSLVVICECLRQPTSQIPAAVFFTGLASLVVAPVAAAPLAVGWNRHR